MNHPTREQWMDFLYEEIDATEKNRLAAHLKSCAVCERQISAWRGTMASLDQWSIPAKSARFRLPIIRWAAAAAIFLAAGTLIGKATQSSPDKTELQSLRSQITEQQQRIDEMAREFAETRARDRQTLLALETRRSAELQNLRNAIETVAVLTQESFNDAQSQLVSLAKHTGAASH